MTEDGGKTADDDESGDWTSSSLLPQKATGGASGGVPLPRIQWFTPQEQEKLRRDLRHEAHVFQGRWILLWGTFITILVILIGAGVLIATGSMTVPEAKDLFPILLPPLFTLLGTAAALYFGQDR